MHDLRSPCPDAPASELLLAREFCADEFCVLGCVCNVLVLLPSRSSMLSMLTWHAAAGEGTTVVQLRGRALKTTQASRIVSYKETLGRASSGEQKPTKDAQAGSSVVLASRLSLSE